ncbi:hypothetical protein ACVMAJ_006926 [Bradyrhizobium sp. USDA 4448]
MAIFVCIAIVFVVVGVIPCMVISGKVKDVTNRLTQNDFAPADTFVSSYDYSFFRPQF